MNMLALCSELAPLLAGYVPFSFFGYFAILGAAKALKVANPGVHVSSSLQLVHNVFLSVQSLLLMVIVSVLYTYTAEEAKVPPSAFLDISVVQVPARIQSKYFDVTIVCFLLSKLYETLDTVVLILNGKPLLLLHVWHHATTYVAFYTGLFTGAGFWIGMLNSFIHVIMYLYYAKLPGMKLIAKYITSMQLVHLLGGGLLNIATVYTALSSAQPTVQYRGMSVNIKTFGLVNMALCFSYFFFFLAFFSKKYHKNGSIWTLFHAPRSVQKAVLSFQKAHLPAAVEQYLCAQGLLVPDNTVKSK